MPEKTEQQQEEVINERMKTLEMIAQRVGGDFGMKVMVGKPGGGSFFNPETVSITFDPLQLAEDDGQAKFIAGHEGAHRAITPNPKEIGLSVEKTRELYSQLGFPYMQNVIEDGAVNGWLGERFVGLKDYIRETYDKQFKEQNAVLSTPEVQEFAACLGYWPKFAQAGSEFLRDWWHKGEFSENLDPKVRKFLERTIDDARKSIQTIPSTEKMDRQETIQKGKERFYNNTDNVWPEMKKLVEMDLQTEAQRQMLNEKESKAFESLPEDAKKELKEKIEEALSKMKEASSGQPIPMDKLSDNTKEEIEKLFKKLPKRKQKELIDKAKKELEAFEDEMNKGMQGKLKLNPESHLEKEQREKAEEERMRQIEQQKQELEKIEKELEKQRRESMSNYERMRADEAGSIDDFYYRLRKIFKPEEYGGEEVGFLSGQRLDITRAMQANRDVEQKHRLFIREVAPEERKYSVVNVLDVSGSMAGEKIQETMKGFVVATGGLDRVEDLNSDTINIRQGIIAFHDRIFPCKGLGERFSSETEEIFSGLAERVHDNDAGTNTYEATLSALEMLGGNLGTTGNFILTFSDGEPNYAVRDELKKLLKEGKEERKKKKIKVGLIWLGESEDKEKLDRMVEEYGYDFGLAMSAVKPSEEEMASGKKDFSAALADLMEDIIENPDKY